jgi:hypothetical protein
VPRLGRREFVLFHVDTGAEVTMINARDAAALGFQAEDASIEPVTRIQGLGGSSRVSVEHCILEFLHTDGSTDSIGLPVYFAQPGEISERFQSLLGWDVLANYRITIEKASGLVALEYPEGP